MNNMKVLIMSFFVVIILPACIGLSYGQVFKVANNAQVPPALPMTVKTDKVSYSDGDKIMISGTVRDPMPGNAVTIKIRSPNNNIVMIGQAPLSDGVFSSTFTAGGNLWQDAGKYEIDVQLGSKDAVTTFQFDGYVPFDTMHVDGTDVMVSYKIVGGQLVKISPNVQTKSLVLSIKTTSDGSLTIVLPRSLIDSQSNGHDIPFTVLVDGRVVEHKEQSSSSSDRTLVASFARGSTEIIISGTSVIPEFGPVAVLVFAIAILSIIVVLSKSSVTLTRFHH